MPAVRTAVMLVTLLAAARAHADAGVTATASALEPPSRIGVAIGADVYLFDGNPSLGAGEISVTYGDGLGADFETRLSTILLVSTIEMGPRVYLGDGAFKPYLHADLGMVLFLAIPVDVIVTAGLGVQLGSHVELDASYVRLGDPDPGDTGYTTRLSAALRF